MTLELKHTNKIDLIKHVESKFIKNHVVKNSTNNDINVGDLLKIGYVIPEGDKERTQYYEGLIIGKQNRGLGKTFTMRRTVQGVGVEQIFLVNSPKIISITKKQSYKIRRAKLYFLRDLIGKKTKLKTKL
jgi:large subunit ribosomal protein L19